jgi:NADH-quinone oxidoreductase subunit N
MSAPLIWIAFPMAVGIGLWFIKDRSRLVFAIAILVSGLLALIALLQPIGGIIQIGTTSFELKSTALVLGRNFILENKDRLFLVFIFVAAVFWFFGSRITNTPSKFIPMSLMIISLLTAALAVEPFLYSAILIELAVIISLPLLIERDKPIGKGVLHYFIYQSLAMPFILFAGWMLTGTTSNPSNTATLQIAALLLGLGFAFWLAVFPFHVWIPELTHECQPYIVGFLLSSLPPVYFMIVLKYIDGLTWFKNADFLAPTLQVVGVVMIVTSGLWAASLPDLKRLFGYLVIISSGFSLLCISLQNQIGTNLFYISLIPHIIALGVFSYALTVLQKNQVEFDLNGLSGLIRKFPVTFIAIFSSILSIIGLPLFAGFSLNLELLEQLSSHTVLLIWIFVGYAAMMIAAFRLLFVVIGNINSRWTISETTGDILFLTAGIFALVLMGIFPSVFMGGIWSFVSPLLALN